MLTVPTHFFLPLPITFVTPAITNPATIVLHSRSALGLDEAVRGGAGHAAGQGTRPTRNVLAGEFSIKNGVAGGYSSGMFWQLRTDERRSGSKCRLKPHPTPAPLHMPRRTWTS